jgi:hypothetical protein
MQTYILVQTPKEGTLATPRQTLLDTSAPPAGVTMGDPRSAVHRTETTPIQAGQTSDIRRVWSV